MGGASSISRHCQQHRPQYERATFELLAERNQAVLTPTSTLAPSPNLSPVTSPNPSPRPDPSPSPGPSSSPNPNHNRRSSSC